MNNKIHKTLRIDENLHKLIEAYRSVSKASYNEAIEILVLKGLENTQNLKDMKQLFKDEMKATREEIRNQGNRIAGININLFKFLGRVYSHTYQLYKGVSNFNQEQINQDENLGINKALEALKTTIKDEVN
ncbi:hypothetical protein FA592_03585 [Sulfurospirillum diekertiae]|uniref:Uncharacterized protein n=1 Tax=Sulfurospirillum diekertiae TaxID=1854492 RepID=A0A6G9VR29_9BACT|nr:hypothetical protein [Sulfurospirillum diekertiae]QIR75357.1 hypothetical protein FA584_03680 [Sulfurospirillum diekertiae]QIR78006.1 hypothetical protein FA592_03585 [Sulfurospirillum diekertiae]